MEEAVDGSLSPVVVLPEDRAPSGPEPSPPQILVPAGAFQVEQGISLKRGSDTGFAVLLKLVEQGPGFELYDFAPVG
jgi:hypothetical protein